MTVLRTLSMLFLISCFGTSCANDSTEQEPVEIIEPLPENINTLIVGKWRLIEGYRNGKKTESLADTYFSFSPNGEMETNLGGSTEAVNYQIEGRTISQDSERFPVDYSIDEIGDSTLMISMTMRDIPFKFHLNREVELKEVQ